MELLSRRITSACGVKMTPPPPPAWMCVRARLLQEWSLFLITGRDLVIKTRANSPFPLRETNGRTWIHRKTNEGTPLSSVTAAHSIICRSISVRSPAGALHIHEDSLWGGGRGAAQIHRCIKHLLRGIWDGSWADRIRRPHGTPTFQMKDRPLRARSALARLGARGPLTAAPGSSRLLLCEATKVRQTSKTSISSVAVQHVSEAR